MMGNEIAVPSAVAEIRLRFRHEETLEVDSDPALTVDRRGELMSPWAREYIIYRIWNTTTRA